jgi:rubredoxin
MSGFENFGRAQVEDETSMECGICWYVYDPAKGDDVWQVPPGTPFSALSEDWRCPICDAPPTKFMRLGNGA